MAILWEKLETTLRTYFINGRTSNNRTISQVCEYIQSQYVLEIMTNAMDPFGNRVIKLGSEIGLKTTLEIEFNNAYNTNSISSLNTNGLNGVKLHWASAQIGIAIPALPAMTVGITNIIDIVGNVPPMNLYNSKNEEILSKEIINSLKIHSTTIGGTYTGINTIPTTPIPVIIKWTGIQ